ncbi:transmembrane protein 94-like [Sinocyclocheilus anshuiensis]|uniref:transmembrane protein 94-like n=2 Tax=Sinocyclocheilus TaxID=75365 RepID=UPI0007B8DC7A|nr:PREDICTED: transmembrane protein 94-like [Sinocyclocheilus anshuiensis]
MSSLQRRKTGATKRLSGKLRKHNDDRESERKCVSAVVQLCTVGMEEDGEREERKRAREGSEKQRIKRQLGLSSVEALSLLHTQLLSVLQQHRESCIKDGHWKAAWSRCFLHHSVRWSSLHWSGVLLTTLCATSLITCHVFEPNSDSTALIGGCTVLLLLLTGLIAMTVLQWLKREEMPRRVETLLNTLQEFLKHPSSDWLRGTEDLFTPPCPAVSRQWTYRDGKLVNLPVSLLVEGDIISLRSEAPTELRGIQFTRKRPSAFCAGAASGAESVAYFVWRSWCGTVACHTPAATCEWCFAFVAPDFPPALGSCVHVRRGPCSFTDGLTASGLEMWKLACKKCYSVFWGQTSTLCHTASLLHSLGSVTVLCCVDKQGILSWPSPNPEKILFFSRSISSQETERQRQKEAKRERDKEKVGLKIRSLCSLQMLSLSVGQAQCDDTRVQFDDTCWQRHAPSLRPLGLAVQLVLCDPGVTTRILRLSDHLTHAALVRTRPPCQPVHPPWGLCHLPRILGFSTSAKEPFEQRMSVAAYTLPSISCPGDPGIIAPPSVSMRRLPFSHLIALLVHHTYTGDLQLFSYGSADVILGACTEFWDGEDIQPLTDSDRKKVVDFYQRSCMAGQCVAVSFKPLLQPHDPQIDDTCVELPLNHSTDTTDDVSITPLRQQIFLGLVSSQYQARPDVVRLISGLDSACIRFVYFSSEEEVRSKVFAEKMGLETGWNCHISLQSESFPLDPDNVEEPVTKEEEEILLRDSVRERAESRAMEHDGACLIKDLNRAKLPKGIENVRPHLEDIDNVPLLVPLFTDCTSQTECEMVCIMQEYGEVVCCLGSSQNIDNNDIFLQSDISIALDPLVPTRCWSNSDAALNTSDSLSVIQLSSAICGLACTVQFNQQDNNTVIRLIKQARHTTAGIRKCFLFLLQCQLSLVLIQILACVCQLPPPLGTSDVLFLSCFYFPLLSVSLLGKPSDNSIMKVPTGKNLRFIPKKTLRLFVLCFLVKFGLTVCTFLTCFGLMLHSFCLDINHQDEDLCHPTSLLMNSTVWSPDWYGRHSDGLSLAQKVIAFLVLLNAMCTSISHVHRSAPMWKQSPLSNHCWCAVICIVPVLNASLAMVSRFLWHDPDHMFCISDIPMASWVLGILWLIPLVFINEGIKLHEIRMRVRYQKRQKLQFDTKLGMNSPF